MQEQQQAHVKTSTVKQLHDKTKVRQEFIKRLNALCLKNSFGKRGLQLDPETERVIELICQYLNKESEFEKNDGFSLNKGIWLAGNFGSGKTQIIQAYREVMKVANKATVGFKTCNEMNEAYLKQDLFTHKRAGMDGIKTFANRFDRTERIFDDLGEEETTLKDYGNKICIMAHILSERYKGAKDGCITHITTNLTKKQIGEDYGGRIESRIFEMFNFIHLGSKAESVDYRK